MGGGIFKPIQKLVGGAGKAVGLVQDVQMPAQPAAEQAPAAAPAAVAPNSPDQQTGDGVSNEKAQRKGKKGVTIQRGNQAGGSGLNV